MVGARRFITPEQPFGTLLVQNLTRTQVTRPHLLYSHFGALILQSGDAPLTVSRLNFKPRPAEMFFKALKVARCSQLTFHRIPLGYGEIADQFPILIDNIIQHPFIEEVSFNQCALQDEHATYLAGRLRETHLKKLDLSENFIDQLGAAHLSAAVGNSVKELNLSRNKLEDRIKRILRSHLGCDIIT